MVGVGIVLCELGLGLGEFAEGLRGVVCLGRLIADEVIDDECTATCYGEE